MTLKHVNRFIDESLSTRPVEQTGGKEPPVPKDRHQMRPELRRLFEARWNRNEAGYRYLAGR
jgi:hypothetical protein